MGGTSALEFPYTHCCAAALYCHPQISKKGEPMAVRNPYTIEKICSRIYSECDSLVAWNWDDRFQAVLSEFPAESEEEVMSGLEEHFENCWDEETINHAPGKIRSVAKDLG